MTKKKRRWNGQRTLKRPIKPTLRFSLPDIYESDNGPDDAFDGISGECEMCGKYGGEPRKGGHFMCSNCWQVWNS